MPLQKSAVLKTLLYFDIFSYPLRAQEVHRFCRSKSNPAAVADCLQELEQAQLVYCFEGYYTMRNEEALIRRRKVNQAYSLEIMKKARRNGQLLGQFPFVRAVAISGSLSKNAASEGADIDYFIITKQGRLWVCRTLLHLFKKLTFLAGRQHDFCMNYFLDEAELELKDKNIFTAVESATIIPVYGPAAVERFFRDNWWVGHFLPNQPAPKNYRQVDDRKSTGKQVAEALFQGAWGAYWNRVFKSFTTRRWRRKFKKQGYPMEYFDHDFRSTEGESKNHPFDYQRKVLKAYRERMEAFALITPEVHP